MPNEPTTLEWITAIGGILTPFLLLILSAAGWYIGNRIDKRTQQERYWRALEEKLRDDRLEIYNQLLEPFIILLTDKEVFAKEKEYRNKDRDQHATELLLSPSYKRNSFKLSLMGSDGVVKAFNDLMQYAYKNFRSPNVGGAVQQSLNQEEAHLEILGLLGTLLLEIRISVGNETTQIKNLEMLEWLITDIRELDLPCNELA